MAIGLALMMNDDMREQRARVEENGGLPQLNYLAVEDKISYSG